MARLLLIDVINDKVEEVNIEEGDIHTFHELLNCRCFDITRRQVAGKYYDIFCDDEGLIKEPQPPVSAYDIKNMEPMLVGNLILAHHDSGGNTTDLSDEDIQHIKRNLMLATSINRPNGYKILACQY